MYRIVVIDDDNAMRKLFQQVLTPEGFDCKLAATAADGLKACARERPDLILLDVNLPDANGIAVCRELKADANLRHIPILLVTGEALAIDSRVSGIEAGADDYIAKPFDVEELLFRIKGILKASARPT